MSWPETGHSPIDVDHFGKEQNFVEWGVLWKEVSFMSYGVSDVSV